MPDPDPLVGQRVSNYEIIRRLGQGGMGVVYLARHLTLERDVAVKFLAGQLSNNQDYVDRFLREARSAAKLNHPNIISVYDAGSQDDVYYFVMEYVEGQDFAHLLKKVKRFPELEAIGHVRKAADAMAYAHQAGIIHRDLKPENLILTKGGEVKVGDLGLAKEVNGDDSSLTMSGVVMGTPFYISPEQVRGARDVDNRTDIYSLGATLYHLTTGSVPYRGTSPAEIMSKHLTEPFPWPQTVNPDLSEGICRVMYKMMAKEPGERFQSMLEVSKVLGELAAGQAAQVAAAIDVSASGIATASPMASTQIGALPSAFGATGPAPGAAPSAIGGQSAAVAPQPSIYTIPPTEVATRVGGIIGVSVVVGCLLIGGILWFALGGKKHPAPTVPPAAGELTEAQRKEKEAMDEMRAAAKKTAARMNVLDEMEEQKAKEAFKKDDKPPLVVPKEMPVLPPSPPAISPAVTSPSTAPEPAARTPAHAPEKMTEKPTELAMAKPPSPIPAPAPAPAAPPKFVADSDFEGESVGSLPQSWRAYAQEAQTEEEIARKEPAKSPRVAEKISMDLGSGARAGWEVVKTPGAHGGDNVLRLSQALPEGMPKKFRCGIQRTFHLEGGKKYSFTFWARSGNEPVEGNCRFGRTGPGQKPIKPLLLKLTDEWEKTGFAFEPSETGDFTMAITLNTAGEMWIDDIHVGEAN